jgi:hypothetical protein
LKAKLSEESLRDIDNKAMRVLFLDFLIGTQVLTTPPVVRGTMVIKQTGRFPQMGLEVSNFCLDFTQTAHLTLVHIQRVGDYDLILFPALHPNGFGD